MSDSSRILAGIACGAALGGLVAYLILTPHGRHATQQLNPALEDLSALLRECRRALRHGQHVEREVRGVAEDVQKVIAGEELPAQV